MDYIEIYKTLIIKRSHPEKVKYKTHQHHIIPKHMGGNNDKENLAHLYVRDHALAHWILFKIHRRLEDKVAYKMLLGKKKDAEKLRIQLALIAYPPHKRKQFFLKNNPSFDKELVKKAMNTKRLKYNGNVFSEEGMNNIKLANLGKKHSPESKIKLKLSMKAFLQSLTKEEKAQIYGRNGPQNGNFGTKRPNELAGNFGKSKGEYSAISSSGEIIKFASLEKAMEHGFDEGVLKRNKNTGIPIKRGKWAGFLIEFKENEDYGRDYNKKHEAF